MSIFYHSIYSWARKTTTSFAELRFMPSQRPLEADLGDGLAYRLRHWPELPDASRTAGVLGALSMMSTRPVNRRWIIGNSKLKAEQVDQLLQWLVDDDAVEVIDTTGYPAAPAAQGLMASARA